MNLWPGLLLQSIMLCFIAAYLLHDGTQAFLAKVGGIKAHHRGANESCDWIHIWSQLGAHDAHPMRIWDKSGRYLCRVPTDRPWLP